MDGMLSFDEIQDLLNDLNGKADNVEPKEGNDATNDSSDNQEEYEKTKNYLIQQLDNYFKKNDVDDLLSLKGQEKVYQNCDQWAKEYVGEGNAFLDCHKEALNYVKNDYFGEKIKELIEEELVIEEEPPIEEETIIEFDPPIEEEPIIEEETKGAEPLDSKKPDEHNILNEKSNAANFNNNNKSNNNPNDNQEEYEKTKNYLVQQLDDYLKKNDVDLLSSEEQTKVAKICEQWAKNYVGYGNAFLDCHKAALEYVVDGYLAEKIQKFKTKKNRDNKAQAIEEIKNKMLLYFNGLVTTNELELISQKDIDSFNALVEEKLNQEIKANKLSQDDASHLKIFEIDTLKKRFISNEQNRLINQFFPSFMNSLLQQLNISNITQENFDEVKQRAEVYLNKRYENYDIVLEAKSSMNHLLVSKLQEMMHEKQQEDQNSILDGNSNNKEKQDKKEQEESHSYNEFNAEETVVREKPFGYRIQKIMEKVNSFSDDLKKELWLDIECGYDIAQKYQFDFKKSEQEIVNNMICGAICTAVDLKELITEYAESIVKVNLKNIYSRLTPDGINPYFYAGQFLSLDDLNSVCDTLKNKISYNVIMEACQNKTVNAYYQSLLSNINRSKSKLEYLEYLEQYVLKDIFNFGQQNGLSKNVIDAFQRKILDIIHSKIHEARQQLPSDDPRKYTNEVIEKSIKNLPYRGLVYEINNSEILHRDDEKLMKVRQLMEKVICQQIVERMPELQGDVSSINKTLERWNKGTWRPEDIPEKYIPLIHKYAYQKVNYIQKSANALLQLDTPFIIKDVLLEDNVKEQADGVIKGYVLQNEIGDKKIVKSKEMVEKLLASGYEFYNYKVAIFDYENNITYDSYAATHAISTNVLSLTSDKKDVKQTLSEKKEQLGALLSSKKEQLGALLSSKKVKGTKDDSMSESEENAKKIQSTQQIWMKKLFQTSRKMKII